MNEAENLMKNYGDRVGCYRVELNSDEGKHVLGCF